jgi:hypothetical protein
LSNGFLQPELRSDTVLEVKNVENIHINDDNWKSGKFGGARVKGQNQG